MHLGFRGRTFDKHHLQARRKIVAAGILVAGFATGLFLYLTASVSDDVLGDQANASKQYLRQMEEYGGTINVLASQMRQWFDGLWHGPTLGITVACLSVLLAAAVFLALTPLPPPTDGSGGARGDNR